MKRFFCSILLLGLTVGSTGCSTNFPYGTSWDRHNFLSTVHRPLSLELMDTVSREVVWSLDVPVNMKAVVDLEHKRDWSEGFEPASPAYKVAWKVMPPGDVVNFLDNTQMLNGNPVLLKVKVRQSPELPIANAGEIQYKYSGERVTPQPAPKPLVPKAEPQPTPITSPEPAPAPAPEVKPAPAPEPAPETTPAKPTPEDLEGALEK